MSQENSGSEEQGGQEPADFNLTGSKDQGDLEPPDSKKFQLELERLIGLIRKEEIKLKSLEKLVSTEVEKTSKRDREELKSELENLRTQREEEILARKQHDLDLKGLNMQVLKKNDTCTKLQAGLRYKSESRIDEAVRRLEHQMQIQQLKLSEEKRIVAEIDMLRRTKRNLSEYLVVKQDVEQLRRKQKISRMHRDACVRKITALKSKEEEIKTLLESEVAKESDKAKSEQAQWLNEIDVLKKELSELQNRKKSMKANFAKERSEYYSAIKEAKKRQREVSTKKTSNEGLLLLKEVVRKQPFEAEKALCDRLISHMERLHTGGFLLSDSQDAQRPPDAPDKNQTRVAFLPGFEDSFPPGGVFLRRKSASDDMVGIYAGHGKMSRRGSKKGRRSSAKEVPRKLNLHPEVVEHLLSLGLSPPSTGADIPKVLEELQDKKDFFDAAKSPNATRGQSIVPQMSPITEESSPEFPGRFENCSDFKVSSSYENGVNVCNDIDVQRDASETKRPKANDLELPVTSDEVSNKSYISNRAASNGMKPQERDTNGAACVEFSEHGVPIVGSFLLFDNYTLYPVKQTTESTVVVNGSQSDNERTDDTGQCNEAVANKEYIGSTEDNNHGSKDAQSKKTDGHSETICNSVSQTDGFCFPGFLNQEAPSVGEKCPA